MSLLLELASRAVLARVQPLAVRRVDRLGGGRSVEVEGVSGSEEGGVCV